MVKKADDDTVAAVLAGAESGSSTNFLDGEYQSRGKIDLLGVPHERRRVQAGHEPHEHAAGTASGPPEVVPDVDDLTKPVGTRDGDRPARLPDAAELPAIAAKLRAHNIRVTHARQADARARARSSRSSGCARCAAAATT